MTVVPPPRSSLQHLSVAFFQDTMGWGENDRGVSFTFGAEVAAKFLHKHDFDLICRAHQVSYRVLGFEALPSSRQNQS